MLTLSCWSWISPWPTASIDTGRSKLFCSMRVAVTTTGSACTVGTCAAAGGTASADATAAAATDRVGTRLIIGALVAAERRARRAELLRLRVRRDPRAAFG
jgi:hypothetical protein